MNDHTLVEINHYNPYLLLYAGSSVLSSLSSKENQQTITS